MTTIQQIQTILGVDPDDDFGTLSWNALQSAIGKPAVISAIQGILVVKQDGIWGNLSRGALYALIDPPSNPVPNHTATPDGWYQCITSEFATDADLTAYNKAIAAGKSQEQAFSVGDNCIGCWGDKTNSPQPMIALPPEIMEQMWGAPWKEHAEHKQVQIYSPANPDNIITAEIDDVMPHEIHIQNGAGMDSNEAACKALGLPYGAMVPVIWRPSPRV